MQNYKYSVSFSLDCVLIKVNRAFWASVAFLFWLECFFQSEQVELFLGVPLAEHDLMAIDKASDDEIDSCLKPEGTVFRQYVMKGGSHGVDAYKSVDSESGREEV